MFTSLQPSQHAVLDARDQRRVWNWILARQGLADDGKISTIVAISHASLGLHAARLQSPFATVLARATAPSVALDLLTISAQADLTTIRCMRKTLHVLPPGLAVAAHAATMKFRERDTIRAIVRAGIDLDDVERTVDQITKLLSRSCQRRLKIPQKRRFKIPQ